MQPRNVSMLLVPARDSKLWKIRLEWGDGNSALLGPATLHECFVMAEKRVRLEYETQDTPAEVLP